MNKPEEKTKNNQSNTPAETAFIQEEKFSRTLGKWLVVVTIFLFTLLVSLYYLSPYSLLNELVIEGTNEVYDQHILESSQLQAGDPLWSNYFSRRETEAQIIEENPQVSDAQLSFTGINDFVIQVEEYETVAYLAQDNHYNKILENGTILDEVFPRPNSNQPILSEFSEGSALRVMLEEYVKLDDQIKLLISEVEYVENDRNDMLVHVYMNDGNEVIASIPLFSERLNYYPEMVGAVDDEKGLFDLEAGAYFIPYDTEEEDENSEDVIEIDE